jgi:hypothetical protein
VPTYVFKWSDRSEANAVDLDDECRVWAEAVSSVGQLLRDLDGNMAAPYHLSLEVFGDDGELLAEVTVDAQRLNSPP